MTGSPMSDESAVEAMARVLDPDAFKNGDALASNWAMWAANNLHRAGYRLAADVKEECSQMAMAYASTSGSSEGVRWTTGMKIARLIIGTDRPTAEQAEYLAAALKKPTGKDENDDTRTA